MKLVLKLVSVVVAIGLAPVNAEPVNKKCPVSGEDVDAAVTAKYTAVLGFCCKKCVAKFKENPDDAKFAAALKAAAGKPVNTVCPISGEDIDDTKTVVYNGQTVGMCCGKCVKKFSAEPAKFAAKVKANLPANEKCPVSGEDVDAATAVAHTQEIGFCCKKCLAKFKKDPAAALAKK
jgi:YHS domain-containing protein